jgi:hypothetical protein
MARLLVAGSSNRYEAANLLGITDYPFAIMGRIRITAEPGGDMVIAGFFKTSGGGNHIAHYVVWGTASGGSLGITSSSNSDWQGVNVACPDAGNWFPFVARFESSTDKQLFIPGAATGVLSAGRDFNSPTKFLVGVYGVPDGSYGAYFDGDIADLAVVNVGTDAWHRSAFFDGFSPRAIFPAHQIVDSWDFFGHVTNEPGRNGNVLTPNGTPAQSAHGGSYYYPNPQTWPLASGGGGGGGLIIPQSIQQLHSGIVSKHGMNGRLQT